MKAFADVVVGDKIQYGASDLFRTVTDIEKGRGVNGFTVFVVLDGVARFAVDARDWVFCIEKGQVRGNGEPGRWFAPAMLTPSRTECSAVHATGSPLSLPVLAVRSASIASY